MPGNELPPERPDEEFGNDELPPHPFDRPWFHPSELTAFTTSSRPRSRWLRSWIVPALTAIGGATVVVALVTTGAFEGDGTPNPRASRAATATAITASTHPAERVVIESGSSVVAVRVASGGTTIAASGVALASDRVLTSASLVAPGQGDADDKSDDATITVSTLEGDILRAHIMGIDPATDLALLSLSSAMLPVARLTRDDRLTAGQSVLALGATGGSHRWVSQGVVAGLDRLVTTSSAAFAGLIETDIDPPTAAAGGSLVNDDGEVVGILSRIAPGHALPIDLARDVAEQLATNGRARHSWLGVGVSDAPDQAGGGAKIEFVVPDSPADDSGLVPGDVVSSFGSDGITDMADFMAAQLRRKPGDPVMIMVWRDGKKQRIQVSLGGQSDAT